MDAVLFDFDGTLLQSEQEWDKYLWPLVEKTFPGATREEFEPLQGMTNEQGFEHFLKLRKTKYTWDEYMKGIMDFIPKIYESAQLTEGALDLMQALREACIPMAIATSSLRSWVIPSLESHNITHFFDHVITLDDVKNPKPAPDPYLLAAHRLPADPPRCIVFEDSKSGVRSAKAAGMVCIGIDYDKNQSAFPADLTIQHFSEVNLPMLRQLTGQ